MATSANSNPGRSAAASRAHLRRRRSLAAVVAGVTLGSMLTVASGLSGLIPGLGAGASAATVLSGKTFRDHNRNGVQDAPKPGDGPEVIENPVSPVTVTAYTASGAVAGTAVTAADGTWSISTDAAGPFRVEFTNFPAKYTSGLANAGTSVQFPTSGTANFGLLAKVNGLGQIEDLTGIPVEIGDRVWKDLDANGIQDPGEPGIPGVVVRLIDADLNTLVRSTTTAGDGLYSFPDLILFRNYRIEIDPGQDALKSLTLSPQFARTRPSDSLLNDSNGALAGGVVVANATTRGAGDNDHTFDFGFYEKKAPTYCLGDFVWDDTNRNGIQDGGENGVAGVTATVFAKGSTTPLGSATTGTDGAYKVCGLVDGDYDVAFTNIPAGKVISPKGAGGDPTKDSDADPTTGRASATIAGKDNLDIDLGVNTPPTIKLSLGDYVFIDSDGNGQQNAGDVPVQGALVTLLDANGTPVPGVAPQSTGADGKYLFTNLDPGTYRVKFTRPTGTNVTPTTPNTGPDATDSDAIDNGDGSATTGPVTLVDKDDLTVDAGWIHPHAPTYCLGDFVWDDVNRNGIQDAGEAGINGVTVTVYAKGSSTVLGTATTAGSGAAAGGYKVCGLVDGDYDVAFTNIPAGKVISPKGAGSDPTKDSDADPATGRASATIAGKDNIDIDLGVNTPVQPKAAIGDRVWLDADKDGVQSSDVTAEPGIAGARVTLLTAAGAVVATTTTDSNGNYLFENLEPGTYRVRFEAPAGQEGNLVRTVKDSTANGGTDATDSDADVVTGETGNYTLASGDRNLTVDSGWYPKPVPVKLCVGDFVWNDTNDNGIQDAGEPGVGGVRATLYNAAGQELFFTITDSNGAWKICNLDPGTYSVVFSNIPADVNFAKQNAAGSTTANDSNADANGRTASFTLTNADNLTIDAGVVKKPVTSTKRCVGDYVWNDTNRNGLQDAGEPGVAGVRATLYNAAGQEVLFTITDSNGAWKICGIDPGDYYVVFTNIPAGTSFTGQLAGSNDAVDSNANASGRTPNFTVRDTDVLTIDAGIVTTPIIIITAPPTTAAPTTVPTTAAPTTLAPTTAPPTTAPARPCLGDKVFRDPSNGAKDGIGIGGVTVVVTKPDGSSETAVTDSNGIYGFCSLVPGTYTVKVTGGLPAGARNTYDLDGNNDSAATVVLPAGQSNLDVDFGYTIPNVKGEVLPAPATPAFTGANSATLALWALALMLIGFGIYGLATARRKNEAKWDGLW